MTCTENQFLLVSENNLSNSLSSLTLTMQKNSKNLLNIRSSVPQMQCLKQLQLNQGNVYLGFGQFSGETIGFAVT